MITTRKKGRVAAVSAVIAGLVLGTALTASAEPADPFPFPDPAKDGHASLTITKLADPSGNLVEGNGREAAVTTGGKNEIPGETIPADAYPIPGVQFKITRMPGYNLTEEGGWSAATDLATELANARAEGAPGEAEADVLARIRGDASDSEIHFEDSTGTHGAVTFPSLPFGLYLVEEISAPDGIIATTAVPFLVTLPMTDPVNLNEWMYDVYAYPKNADVTTLKTVMDDDAAFLGDTVTFDVEVTLPRNATKLVLTDVLDERLWFSLDPIGVDEDGNAIPSLVWLVGDEEFAYDPDFDLGNPPLYPGTVSYVNNKLEVEFSDAFLAAYNGENGEYQQIKVGFQIKTTVVGGLDKESNVTTDFDEVVKIGVIKNQAKYSISTKYWDAEGESNEVETKWGKIDVSKVGYGVGDKDPKLDGAWFCLALTKADADAGKCASEEQKTVGGKTTFYVRYSDFANGKDLNDPENGELAQTAWNSYWLIETQAPDGFELSTAPVELEVIAKESGVAKATVINYPHNAGHDLPLIGGNRTVLPILAAVIAAGGVVFLIRSRRQQAQKA